MPAFERAFADNDAEIAAVTAQAERRPSATPSRRWSAAASCSTGSPACSSTSPAPTPTMRCWRSSARSGRSSPPTATASCRTTRCSSGSMRSIARAIRLISPPSSAACSTAITSMYRRAGAGLDAATKARLADIAQRLATLGTSFSQNVLADEQDYTLALETEDDLAGLPDFVRARRARPPPSAAWPASTSSRCRAPASSRSCSSPPAATCARRRSAPGSRAATGRRDRQQGGDRRDGGAARRARQAARLRELCALPARRRHGEDAGSGARPARSGLGAGARRCARRPRRHAGAGAAGGRQLHDRAVGLALLRREAAQGRAATSTRRR